MSLFGCEWFIRILLHTEAHSTTHHRGSMSHIGQTFWDQSVRDQVELLYPYNTNTQSNLANADDRVIASETETNGTTDPFFNYVQLGDNIQDGFLAWIVLGVNTSLTASTISPAAEYYASGGVEVSVTEF